MSTGDQTLHSGLMDTSTAPPLTGARLADGARLGLGVGVGGARAAESNKESRQVMEMESGEGKGEEERENEGAREGERDGQLGLKMRRSK